MMSLPQGVEVRESNILYVNMQMDMAMVRDRFGLWQASSSTSQDCENTGCHQCHEDSHYEESAAVNEVSDTDNAHLSDCITWILSLIHTSCHLCTD